MAKKTVLQEDYRLGIRRDVARDAMPNNAVWDMWDFIPDRLGSPIEKRGGWTSLRASQGVTGAGIAYVPFSGGHRLAWLAGGNLRHALLSNLASSTDHAAYSGATIYQNPVFFRDHLIVPRGGGQLASLTSALAFAAVAASAPNVRYATVYKDRAVGGYMESPTAAPNRVQFGPIGLPTGTWDTTNAWVDTSFPVAGLYAMRNALLVYHSGSVERIRGSVPPGTAGFDMVLENLFTEVGCLDARSIVGWQENVIWADHEGLFMTDGAALLDLTAAGGVKDLWRESIEGFVENSWRCTSGVYSGFLVTTILNASGVEVATFVCELSTRTWMRFTNFPFAAFAHAAGVSDEVYALVGTNSQVASLSSILTPTNALRTDGNGTAILPGLETGYFVQRQGLANWKDLYIGYDLRDEQGLNPVLTVQAAGVEESFASIGTLPESTRFAYRRLSPRTLRSGIALRITQSAASAQTRLYQMTADAAPLPDDRIV